MRHPRLLDADDLRRVREVIFRIERTPALASAGTYNANRVAALMLNCRITDTASWEQISRAVDASERVYELDHWLFKRLEIGGVKYSKEETR
jgi:hypothetical protein